MQTKNSPMYAHFSESLAGAHTINAFGARERFEQGCDRVTTARNRVMYYQTVIEQFGVS